MTKCFVYIMTDWMVVYKMTQTSTYLDMPAMTPPALISAPPVS